MLEELDSLYEFQSETARTLFRSVITLFSEYQLSRWVDNYGKLPSYITKELVLEMADFFNNKCKSEKNTIMVPVYYFPNDRWI